MCEVQCVLTWARSGPCRCGGGEPSDSGCHLGLRGEWAPAVPQGVGGSRGLGSPTSEMRLMERVPVGRRGGPQRHEARCLWDHRGHPIARELPEAWSQEGDSQVQFLSRHRFVGL